MYLIQVSKKFFENDLKVLLEKFEKYIKINYLYKVNIKKNTKISLKNFKQKI
jgi:CRISPR/Cas system-associated endonuclease Cas3-HD